MTDANLTEIRYLKNTWGAYGELPTGNPEMKLIPFARESLQLQQDNIRSPVIRSDRHTADQFRVSVRENGDIEGPLAYGVFDDFLEYGLFSDAWVAASTAVSLTVTVNASAKTFTQTNGNEIDTSVAVGDWVRFSGFSGAATGNNGWWKVSAVTDPVLTVSGGTGTLTDVTDDTGVTRVRGAYLNASSTFSEMYVEKEYGGLTDKIVQIPGCYISQVRLETARRGFFNCRFSILGQNEDIISATLGDSSPVAVNANIVMNTVDHLIAVVDDAVLDLTQFSWNLNNNLEAREVMGTFGPASIGVGSIELSGDAQFYLDDTNIGQLDHFHDQTEIPFAIVAHDKQGTPFGNSYVFDMPANRYQTARHNAEGIDTQVFGRMTWGGKTKLEGAANRMFRIFRFDA